jgi:hypothetical protein
MQSIAHGNGVYVAVGYRWSLAGALSSIYTSASIDGPFSEQFYPDDTPLNGTVLVDVKFLSDGYFYAIGSKAHYFPTTFISTSVICRSSDGATWVDVTPPDTLATTQFKGSSCIKIFELDSGLKVILGINCNLTSMDGVTWTEHPIVGHHWAALTGACNGDVVAASNVNWTGPTGPLGNILTVYYKPVIYDGVTYTPDIDSIYTP